MELVEGEDVLDEVGLESTSDLAVLDLLEDVEPGISGAEEESDLGEVEIRVLVRKVDVRDAELELTLVGKPKLVEGDNRTVIGSDIRRSDLSETKRK